MADVHALAPGFAALDPLGVTLYIANENSDTILPIPPMAMRRSRSGGPVYIVSSTL